MLILLHIMTQIKSFSLFFSSPRIAVLFHQPWYQHEIVLLEMQCNTNAYLLNHGKQVENLFLLPTRNVYQMVLWLFITKKKGREKRLWQIG